MHALREFIRKNKILLLIVIICLIILIIGCIVFYKETHKIRPNLNKMNLEGYNKLMIVAHPDDEILWGGAHLLDDKYLVVCITCGSSTRRVNEFVNVMRETEDKYIMLGYPDKTNGERDNWESVYDYISKDLKDIINLKDWELIVVHNPDGEYGHIHHKMTSKMTTDIIENKDKLYYFGHYYSKKTIQNHYDELYTISGRNLKQKKKLIGIYRSQSFIQTAFDHMFSYENWLTYEEWNSEQNEKA